MDIVFATIKLANAAVSLETASRLLGRHIGRKYIHHIGILRSVDNFDELYALRPLRLHPLIERMYLPRRGIFRVVENLRDRSGIRVLRPRSLRDIEPGQYAMHVSGGTRLIIQRIDEERVRVLGIEDDNG
jgi:hypothetical protein